MTVILLGCTNVALASELADLVEQCDGCHGADGVSQWTDMPTIAGISDLVHADALFVYLEDGRPCREGQFRTGDTSRDKTDMCAVSKTLSESQIDELAAYYFAKPFVAAEQEFDPALAARGRIVHEEACEKCHTDGGANVEDDASLLKGQWMGYTRQTLADYNAGERQQPRKMKEKLGQLSDDDVEALVHFYASPE